MSVCIVLLKNSYQEEVINMDIDVINNMTIEEYEQFCEEQKKRNEGLWSEEE